MLENKRFLTQRADEAAESVTPRLIALPRGSDPRAAIPVPARFLLEV